MLAGVPVAYAAVRLLLRYGASQLPRLETVPFDTPVLLFAIAMLVVCALGVGFAPMLQLSGSGIEAWLRERGRTVVSTRSTHRALPMMIIAEVAVAVTIVAGTGLLVRSFLNLQRNDPGFVSRGRLTLDVLLPFQRYRGPGVRRAWMQTLFTNLRNIRGVTAVAGSSDFPCGPFEPLLAMQSCVTRTGWDGAPIGQTQRISALQALELYTTGAAYASGEHGRKGRLAPGYLADFVVLGEDPLQVEPTRLGSVPVQATYVGGTQVWPTEEGVSRPAG
jgi:hypothetical protein